MSSHMISKQKGNKKGNSTFEKVSKWVWSQEASQALQRCYMWYHLTSGCCSSVTASTPEPAGDTCMSSANTQPIVQAASPAQLHGGRCEAVPVASVLICSFLNYNEAGSAIESIVVHWHTVMSEKESKVPNRKQRHNLQRGCGTLISTLNTRKSLALENVFFSPWRLIN